MRKLLILCLLVSCSKSRPVASNDPVAKGVEYLFSKQKADGSFKSELYTVLKSGQALTPFVLYALSYCQPATLEKHRQGIAKAVAFIKDQAGADGRIGFRSDPPEYPTYAMALAVLALRKFEPGFNSAKIVEQLKSLQLAQSNGWDENDPEFGSFDYGNPFPKKPQYNRPDISKTAFAIEAIGNSTDEAVKKAVKFVSKCQNPDGGLRFTTSEREKFMNKAGENNSYGTATCDGIRAMMHAGGKEGSWQSAQKWLKSNLKVEVPGFDPEDKTTFRRGLFFYWAFSVSILHRKLDLGNDFALGLKGKLESLQHADGSFRNEFGIMKEDETIIATSFAIIALANLAGIQ